MEAGRMGLDYKICNVYYIQGASAGVVLAGLVLV